MRRPRLRGKPLRRAYGIWGLETPDVVWEAGNQPGGQVGRVLEVELSFFSGEGFAYGQSLEWLLRQDEQVEPHQLPLRNPIDLR